MGGGTAAAIARAVAAGNIDSEVDQIDLLDVEVGPIDLQAGHIDRDPHQIDRSPRPLYPKPPVRDGLTQVLYSCGSHRRPTTKA